MVIPVIPAGICAGASKQYLASDGGKKQRWHFGPWKMWEPRLNGRSPGSYNGGTVPYKAIFLGYIPLHSPYIGLIYARPLESRILKWPLIGCSVPWCDPASHTDWRNCFEVKDSHYISLLYICVFQGYVHTISQYLWVPQGISCQKTT